jgi:hypothetical protein
VEYLCKLAHLRAEAFGLLRDKEVIGETVVSKA